MTACRPYSFILLLLALFLIMQVLPAEARPESIRVVMDDNYPPFSFRDSAGKQQGILVDQWRLWERKNGIRVEISAMDWGKALSRMKTGEFDVIDTIFKTGERTKWLDFTKPYVKLDVPIFFDSNISGINNAGSLKGFAVGAKTGDAAVELLKSNGVENPILFNNYESVIQAAKERKINVFVVDKPPAIYFLNKLAIQNNFKQSAPLAVGEFHRAVNKGDHELLQLVEEGFARITPEELKKIENTWYGAPLFVGRSLRYFLYAAAGSALLILVLLLWNRFLQKTVTTRTAELKRSDELFQSIYNSVNDAIFIHELESGAILDVNQRMCKMFGCSREEACSKTIEAFSAGMPPYSQTEAIDWMTKAARGEPQIFEWLAKTASGNLFWVEVNMRRSRIGAEDRILVTTRDISARKAAEADLRESRAFSENLLQTANAMIIGLDLSGHITIFNPAAEKITGYSRNEIENLNWFETLTPKERYPQVWEEHQRLTAGGIPKYFENPILTKSGEERFIVWSNNEVMESGRIIGTISFGQDVTERKQAEDSLRESEERLRVIFSTSDSGIILVTPQGLIDFANKRMAEMFDISLQELVGTYYPDHLHESEKMVGDERMRMLILGEIQSVANERRYIRKDGTVFWGYLSGRRLENPDGSLRALVGVITDISDRKKAEEERLALERQLLHSQKLESLGVLSGGIAHDFNNLLHALLGNLGLALMKLPDDSPARNNIIQAVNAGKHAAKLTNMMLAYSGKGLFIIKELNLTGLVEENAEMLAAAISKSITLDLDLDHNLPAVMADAGQLQQVVMNLITNASEAIGDQCGQIRLSTGVKEFDQAALNHSRLEEKLPSGRYVWMKVRDNGCGMDEEIQQKLFDPFFTTKFTGRGLGMSAVLGIIRAHNGAFLVESSPGVGTTIQVIFPLSSQPISELEDASVSAAEAEADDSRNGFILIVDDEDMIRGVCVAMLEELGYGVLAAAEGEEALQLFREHGDRIGLVLLDQTMPGMDGVEVFKELRSIRADIMVLLASGYSELELDERYKGLGLNGFIQKPFNLEQLADAIRRALKVA